jgi:hypothetical protein
VTEAPGTPLLVKVWMNHYADQLTYSRRLYSPLCALRERSRLRALGLQVEFAAPLDPVLKRAVQEP